MTPSQPEKVETQDRILRSRELMRQSALVIAASRREIERAMVAKWEREQRDSN